MKHATYFLSKKFFMMVFAVLLIIGVLYGLRAQRLLQNARMIGQVSGGFARDYTVGSPTDAPLLYMALGDSISQGTGVTDVSKSLPYLIAQHLAVQGLYVRVINVAQSGARINDVLTKQIPQITHHKPDLITLTIGTNDATHFTNKKEFEAAYRQVLDFLGAQQPTQILIANSADPITFPALPAVYRYFASRHAASQNITLRQLPQDRSVKIIDLAGEGQLRYSQNKAYYAEDLFHPAKSGYEKWSKLFIRSLD